MTTYDPAAPVTHHDFSAPTSHSLTGQPDPATADNMPVSSTLDDLRAAVEQVEQVVEHEFTDHPLFSPGDVIRLTCSTELEHKDWKRIQLASLPKQFRNKRIPDPRKVDEVLAYATVIAQQTTEIAIRQPDETYKPLPGTFEDLDVLGTFGVADAQLAVRRVFGGSDAYLLHAGKDLIEACGLGERKPGEPGEDADGDPT